MLFRSCKIVKQIEVFFADNQDKETENKHSDEGKFEIKSIQAKSHFTMEHNSMIVVPFHVALLSC